MGVLLLGIVLYVHSSYSGITRVFSPYTLLDSSWEKYKQQFINKDGRVIDYTQNGITTSEGQSYAMLRAVWLGDKPTFDSVWHFTSTSMKRPNDNLFGWRWGQRQDKSYGFISGGGDNSAADADSDIAFSLILASRRWNNPKYEDQAKNILKDLWNIETATAGQKRYLIAGNWAQSSNELVINPSYFAPYEWRVFSKVDTTHDWNSLIDPAYQLLNDSSKAPLDKGKGSGLPPDWVALDRNSDSLSAVKINNLTTNYSFDAMRVPWRIAADYQLNKDSQAKDYLLNNFEPLLRDYQSQGIIGASYSHDGNQIISGENPSMYATSLGYFLVKDPSLAAKIYQEKIIKLYSTSDTSFNSNLPYYEQNWLWFGAALYNHKISTF